LKSKVQFRFLTELTAQNLQETKALLKRIPSTGVNLKGRTPDLGLKLYPQMVIRDEEEAIFFIRPQSNLPPSEQDNICLWTNCKNLVLAFSAMFEQSWSKATEIQKKIDEIETGKPTPKTYIINNAEDAYRKYNETTNATQKKIFIITSTKGLIDLSKEITQVKEWSNRGVSVKIMVPITSENSKTAQILSEYCEIKHVPTSYLDSTIVDGQHLFQFKNPSSTQEKIGSTPFFEDMFYTSDRGHIEKTERMFNDLWENAQGLSAVSLESIANPPKPKDTSIYQGTVSRTVKKISDVIAEDENQTKITEKDILKKIINTQLNLQDTAKKGIIKQYGTFGQAIVHTSASLNLPDTLLHMFHYEKTSTFGAEDVMFVCLWRETPKGNFFVPVAFVSDNPRSSRFWKKVLADQPLAQNMQMVKKDELQVQIHGNTFFCGWTVEIPLLPPPLCLKPSCITLEGYGGAKTDSFTVHQASGYKIIHELNGFEAFVTFLSPKSKYSGPGTTDSYPENLFQPDIRLSENKKPQI
jgi:sugar-specific transcriptional regulator TrmB